MYKLPGRANFRMEKVVCVRGSSRNIILCYVIASKADSTLGVRGVLLSLDSPNTQL